MGSSDENKDKPQQAKKQAGGQRKPKAEHKKAIPYLRRRFALEYLNCGENATKAAIAAGYAKSQAPRMGSAAMKDPRVLRLIAEQRELLNATTRTTITAEAVLLRYWKLATADVNDLVQYRRVNCRHCHGHDHKYQWIDEREQDNAVVAAKAKAAELAIPVAMPDFEGGTGFNKMAAPNEDCPVCMGEGHGEVFMQDTRTASEGGKLLYAGVEQTQHGLKIKMNDQMAALEKVARHLGMLNDKITLAGDKENPLSLLIKQIGGTSALPVVADPDDEETD